MAQNRYSVSYISYDPTTCALKPKSENKLKKAVNRLSGAINLTFDFEIERTKDLDVGHRRRSLFLGNLFPQTDKSNMSNFTTFTEKKNFTTLSFSKFKHKSRASCSSFISSTSTTTRYRPAEHCPPQAEHGLARGFDARRLDSLKEFDEMVKGGFKSDERLLTLKLSLTPKVASV